MAKIRKRKRRLLSYDLFDFDKKNSKIAIKNVYRLMG